MASRSKSLLCLGALVAITACGGGGGSSGSAAPPPSGSDSVSGAVNPPAPTPAPAPTVPTLTRDFRVNHATAGRQTLGPSSIAPLPSGGHVVTWHSTDSAGTSVMVRRFDELGAKLGAEIRVGAGDTAAVAALPDGGFVVSWNARTSTGGGGPGLAQRFDAAGAAVGAPFQFNSQNGLFFLVSQPVVLADGRILFVWTFTTFDRTATPLPRMRLFNADGTPAGDEIVFAPQLTTLRAAALPDGGFVVAWSTAEAVNNLVRTVSRTRVYNADATLRRGDIELPPAPGGDARNPMVTALGDDRYAVAWESTVSNTDTRLLASVYGAGASATTVAPAVEVAQLSTTFSTNLSVGAADDGGFVVAWRDVRQFFPTYEREIRTRRFDRDAQAQGAAETIATSTGAVDPMANSDADLRFNDQTALAPASGGASYLLVYQAPDQAGSADWDVLGARR